MNDAHHEVVLGRLPVLTCLDAGKREVFRAFIHDNAVGLEEIINALPPEKITWTDRKHLDKMSQGARHQGVLLHVAPMKLLSLFEWCDNHKEPECLLLILDCITDPMNFGAIIRSAAALGAHGVLFPKDRAAPVNAAVVKAAAGGIEYVPLIQASNLTRDIQHLKKEGFWVVAFEANADRSLWQVPLTGRVAMIIGSEGDGIRRLVKEQADFLASIPMAGNLSSLNASVSAGIALTEWLRQSKNAAETNTGGV
ncbi:MAG: 23S rRNA (guanosine(2251)-2'-O)-methyltransferase RlmB [Candidatus Hydrogenedentes bacterium]|jgi:23S rRNA (guanosine2251-2'-O)-methyltransferase|nr:23S rRNA (guanosine(2251)-2'-O)-methyltransferase RlmB [Candidatus Hydrogenedentota bacterium]